MDIAKITVAIINRVLPKKGLIRSIMVTVSETKKIIKTSCFMAVNINKT